MKGAARIIGSLLLSLLPAACGEQTNSEISPAPESDKQRSESAPGPAKDSEPAKLEPASARAPSGAPAAPQSPAATASTGPTKSTEQSKPTESAKRAQPAKPAKPSEPVKPGPPATLEEVIAAIDLRKLPRLEGARVQSDKVTRFNYSAPGKLDEAAEMYRKMLTELGWTEDKTGIPGIDPKQYFYAAFDKAGFHISVSVTKNEKDGTLNVNLNNYGNVDPRQFARPADAKPTFFYRHYVSYTTAAKPQEAVEFCRKDIAGQGWREYRVWNAKYHAKEGRFLLGFIKNGMSLFLNINSEKDGRTAVASHVEVRDKPVRALAKDLPKPATLSEGRKVIDLHRFPRPQGAGPGQGSSAVLGYDAPSSVADVVSFYRKKLGEQGWKEEPGGHGDDTSATPRFTKAGYQLELFITKGDKQGRVNVQLENKGNVDARQLPRLQEAEDGSVESFGNVHYQTGATIEAAADFYRAELTKLGWKESKGSDGSVEYPRGQGRRVVFRQNACTLRIEIRPDVEGELGVQLVPQLYGALIARPGRPETAMRVIDLRKFPRVGDAPASSATSGAVSYTAGGSVADAARFYRQELAKKDWREERPTPLENDDRARLRFGKEGFIVEVSLLSGEPRGVGVTVNNRGDLDTRELLHLEDAVIDGRSEQEHTIYTTAATVDALDFYRNELPKFGWQLSKGPETIPSHFAMTFMQKACKLVVQITTNDKRKTEVQLKSFVEGESAAVAKRADPRGNATNKPVAGEPRPKTAKKANADGPRPKDVPIPDDAEDVDVNANAKTVRFNSPASVPTLVDYYRKELKAKGWTEDQKKKILVLKEVGVTAFKKGRASLSFTMNRSDDVTTVIIIFKGVEFK